MSSPSPSTRVRSPSEHLLASSYLRSPAPRWQLLVAVLVIAVLMGPMVLTGSTFGGDWPTHLWLVQMQVRNIQALGHPSLFVQSTMGAFEPWYAFYGGTLYSLAATGAILSGGHTLATYILSFALAMAMAYGGFFWIARQAGLRGWSAHIPGTRLPDLRLLRRGHLRARRVA